MPEPSKPQITSDRPEVWIFKLLVRSTNLQKSTPCPKMLHNHKLRQLASTSATLEYSRTFHKTLALGTPCAGSPLYVVRPTILRPLRGKRLPFVGLAFAEA